VLTNRARSWWVLAAAVLLVAVALVALARPARPTEPPAVPMLAMLGTDGGAVRFTAIDPLSLIALPGPSVVVAEYHDAYSFSPDRTRLAIGMSAPSESGPRIGLQILDVARRTVVRSVETGIAAEAVAWIAPTRIVALLQSGKVVVVDADSGDIVASRLLGAPTGCGYPVASDGDKAVLLVTGAGAARSAQLAVAGADGSIRTVTLKRVRVGSLGYACTQTALAVDPAADRAYVVAPGAPIITEVSLDTLAVTEHRMPTIPPGRATAVRRCRPRGAVCSSRRHALWLGNHRLAISGLDLIAAAGGSTTPRPVGVTIVDTRTWTARRLDRHASAATLAGRRLLTFDEATGYPGQPGPSGLRAYAIADGRLLWRRDGAQVGDLQVAGGRAYARGRQRMYVLDPATGRVLANQQFSLTEKLALLP
jgi:PQQ-like domain